MRVGIKKVFSKILLWGCLAAVFAHALTSCSFFQEEDVDDDVVAFNAMQEAAIAQGVALDLLPSGESAPFYATISGTASSPAGFTRTALPSINVTAIVLRNKATGTDVSTADVTTSSNFTFSNVAPGTYNFYAVIGGVTSGPYGYTLASGTEDTDLVLSAGQNFSGMTVNIVPRVTAGGRGAINLSVSRKADSGIANVNYSFSGTVGSGSLAFDDSGKAIISVPDIASGTYTLSLTFMAGLTPVYHAVEVVNVYDGLTTDTWQGNSEYIDGSTGAFTVTKAMVDNFARTTFYVSGTGGAYASVANDGNEGTYFKPFKTLTNAVAAVSSSTLNPGTGGFRIFVDGSLSEAGIDFSPASSKKLTISSIGTSTVTIDAKKYGRLFIAGENADLTLVNLVMQNGKSEERGGGIYVSPGASLTMTNCTVTGCQTTDSVGGGIFCKYKSGTSTTLSMTNTKITGNKIVYGGTTLSGAGIFIENQAGNYTIGQGCEITGNVIDCSGYTTGTTIIDGIGYWTGSRGTHTFASDVKIDGNYFNYASSKEPVVHSTGIHENGATLSIGDTNISTGKESVLDAIGDSVYSKTGKFIRVNGCRITPEQRAVHLNGAANALPGLENGAVLYLGKRGDSATSDFGSYGIINITGGNAAHSYTIQRTNWDNVTSPSVFATINGYGSSKASSFVVMGDGSKGNWSFNGIEFYRGPSTGKGAFRIEGNSAAAVTFNQCRFSMCYAYEGEKMGGAIYMNASDSSVTLSQTSITKSYAKTSGGGVAVCAGTLTVGVGTSIDIETKISGCTDRGIYVKSGATLNIGNAYVNEIYLDDSASVNVNAVLTTTKIMTIIPKSYVVGSQIVTGTNLATNVNKFAIDNINYTISSTGILQLGAVEGLAKLTNNLKSGDNVLVNLDRDITGISLSSRIIGGIDTGETAIIYVPSGANLTLTGKNARTKISINMNGNNANLIYVEDGGTLTLENLEIADSNRFEAITTSGNVTLKNCRLTNLEPKGGSRKGSAIVMSGGTVIMDGGEITNNRNTNDTIIEYGNVVYIGSGSFVMKGQAKISGNTVSCADVYIKSGTFTMESGSSITHSGTGYAVYKNSGTTFNQNGCTVSGSIWP